MKKTNTIAALILASIMLEGCSATTIPAPTFPESSDSITSSNSSFSSSSSTSLSSTKASSSSLNQEVYSSVLDEYIDCFSEGKEAISFDYVGVREVIEKEGLEKSKNRFYYFYKDIMGDEEPELFVVCKEDVAEDPRYMIVGMYSIFDGVAERQLWGYSEDSHFLMKDGSIYNESIKPSHESRSKFIFTDDKIVEQEYYYFTDYGDFDDPEMYWYTFEEKPLEITKCIKLGKVGEYEPDIGEMEYYDPTDELLPLIIK